MADRPLHEVVAERVICFRVCNPYPDDLFATPQLAAVLKAADALRDNDSRYMPILRRELQAAYDAAAADLRRALEGKQE